MKKFLLIAVLGMSVNAMALSVEQAESSGSQSACQALKSAKGASQALVDASLRAFRQCSFVVEGRPSTEQVSNFTECQCVVALNPAVTSVHIDNAIKASVVNGRIDATVMAEQIRNLREVKK